MALGEAVAAEIDDRFRALRKAGTVSAISGIKLWVLVDGGSMLLPKYRHVSAVVGDEVDVDTSRAGAWVVVGVLG
ncbi:hypothetical protein ACQPXB_35840 [Amycolatopsis sp. CA-161197]|uniref:hypothetical protein n=1 Tax=Amycolatopsis sp. CA-161197 TaxID=3239922 RepID=UPI003D8DB721